MKRLLFCLILMMLLITAVSADNPGTIASMEISAYKDSSEPAVMTGRILKVQLLASYELTASNYFPYDITHRVMQTANSATISNVLKIIMGSNVNSNYYIDLQISPFTSTETGSTIPTSFSYITKTATVTTPQPGNNSSYTVEGNYHYQYQYKYTPALTVTAQSGTSISNSSFTISGNSGTIRVAWKINSAQRRYRRRSKNSTSWNSWNSYTTYTPTSNAALPGAEDESYYPSASITFDLAINSFSSMEPNVDYISTIRVIISGT